ncbi:hypothetical protein RND81_01G203300 [Saponaria officinalis]|uniref:LOB domain-containing protein n=1 Tax=Saponaria officinalis TaxID=3572 RepID=A0AAW1NGA0_SAPOF
MSNIHQQQQWQNNNNNEPNNKNTNNNTNNGPCGACKYLRRKCVKGCVFAPYFDSEQGTGHFAAVHKVFGASNASKLILRVPPHKRLDTVVTLCYEALSRVRDPVYGSLSHIFSLQQQVVNMQAELAFVQARLSTLQRLPQTTFPMVNHSDNPQALLDQIASLSTTTTPPNVATSTPLLFDNTTHSPTMTSTLTPTTAELAGFYNFPDYQHDDVLFEDGDLQSLTREFVAKYLPGVKFKSEPL